MIRPPKHDLTGQTFDLLTVTGMIQNRQSPKYQWMCYVDCICGTKQKIVSPQNLLRKRVTSCGCRRDQYSKNTGQNSKCFKGIGNMRGNFWTKIKRGAQKRGYSFEISKEYAYDLYLKQNQKCALTGLPIQFGRSGKSEENTASIDRIDNDLHYIEGNIQWVHKDVNRMRNIFSLDYFKFICELVAASNS